MTKLQTFLQLWKANNLSWILLYLAEQFLSENIRQKRVAFEIKNQLPGFNTIQYNFKEWSNYDWTNEGEEWTNSEEWKKSLINEVLLKYISPGKRVMEVGPGGGRWSTILAEISQKLILIDLTETSIQHCKSKLAGFSNCEYYINDGSNLSFLKTESIDFIWSFDVFVHISPADTEVYLKAFSDLLATDGIAIIHHPAAGGVNDGFRSSMTNDLFLKLLDKYNFEIIRQLDTWGDDHSVCDFQDMITVFKKVD